MSIDSQVSDILRLIDSKNTIDARLQPFVKIASRYYLRTNPFVKPATIGNGLNIAPFTLKPPQDELRPVGFFSDSTIHTNEFCVSELEFEDALGFAFNFAHDFLHFLSRGAFVRNKSLDIRYGLKTIAHPLPTGRGINEYVTEALMLQNLELVHELLRYMNFPKDQFVKRICYAYKQPAKIMFDLNRLTNRTLERSYFNADTSEISFEMDHTCGRGTYNGLQHALDEYFDAVESLDPVVTARINEFIKCSGYEDFRKFKSKSPSDKKMELDSELDELLASHPTLIKCKNNAREIVEYYAQKKGFHDKPPQFSFI